MTPCIYKTFGENFTDLVLQKRRNSLVVRSLIRPKEYCLTKMLKRVTKDNLHNSEWDDYDILGLEKLD